MYQALATALSDVAWWIQFASQVIPISQLSIVTWVIFVIAGSFNSKKSVQCS